MFFSRARNFDQRLAAGAPAEPARVSPALPIPLRAVSTTSDDPPSPNTALSADAVEMKQMLEDLRFQLAASQNESRQKDESYKEELQQLKNLVLDQQDSSLSTACARIDDDDSEGYMKGKQVAVFRETEGSAEESGIMKGTLVCEMRLVDEALRTLTMTIPTGLETAYASLGVDREGGDGEVITYYESLINSYPASESRYRGALYLIANERKTDVFRPYLSDMITKEFRTYLTMIAKHAPLPPAFASLLDSEAQKDKLRSTQLEKEITPMKLDHEAELEQAQGKNEIAMLKGEVEKRATEILATRKKLEVASKQAAENTGLKAQIASLEKSLERTTVTKASILLKDLDKMKEEKEELRAEYDELAESNRSLESEKQQLEKQIRTHSAEMDNLHILLSKTRSSERELKVAIEAKNAEIDDLESTTASPSSLKEIAELRKEITQAQQLAVVTDERHTAMIAQTKADMNDVTAEVASIKQQSEKSTAALEKMKQEAEVLMGEQNRLAAALEASKKENKELKRTIKESASKESKSVKEPAPAPVQVENKVNQEMEKELIETKNKLEVAIRKLAATPPASVAAGLSASAAETALVQMKSVVTRLAKTVTALNQELAAKSNENADLMMRIVNGDNGN